MVWLCQMMGVSRSGFYAWRSRPMSERERSNRALVKKIRRTHRKSASRYGSPRIYVELREQGETCGRHRIARLMRSHGIVAKKAWFNRRYPRHRAFYQGEGNLLLGRAPTRRCDEVWVADHTCVRTHHSWLYLAVVMDLHSRRIIGWSIDQRRTVELTKAALGSALASGRKRADTVFHSDRGIEYVAHDFRTSLRAHGLVQSVSRKANPYDNAHMESFFASLKTEMVHHELLRHLADAKRCIRNYIKFYNHQRRHSALDYRSPVEYEANVA